MPLEHSCVIVDEEALFAACVGENSASRAPALTPTIRDFSTLCDYTALACAPDSPSAVAARNAARHDDDDDTLSPEPTSPSCHGESLTRAVTPPSLASETASPQRRLGRRYASVRRNLMFSRDRSKQRRRVIAIDLSSPPPSPSSSSSPPPSPPRIISTTADDDDATLAAASPQRVYSITAVHAFLTTYGAELVQLYGGALTLRFTAVIEAPSECTLERALHVRFYAHACVPIADSDYWLFDHAVACTNATAHATRDVVAMTRSLAECTAPLIQHCVRVERHFAPGASALPPLCVTFYAHYGDESGEARTFEAASMRALW